MSEIEPTRERIKELVDMLERIYHDEACRGPLMLEVQKLLRKHGRVAE
jgi:hypothetical protein